MIEKIIKNSIKCKHCGDIIISKNTHDFVTCKCGCCSVDGGGIVILEDALLIPQMTMKN